MALKDPAKVDAIESAMFIAFLEFFMDMDYIRKQTIECNNDLMNPLPEYIIRNIPNEKMDSYKFEAVNLNNFTHLLIELKGISFTVTMNGVSVKFDPLPSPDKKRFDYFATVPTKDDEWCVVASRVTKEMVENDIQVDPESLKRADAEYESVLVDEWKPIETFTAAISILAYKCFALKAAGKKPSQEQMKNVMKNYALKYKYNYALKTKRKKRDE